MTKPHEFDLFESFSLLEGCRSPTAVSAGQHQPTSIFCSTQNTLLAISSLAPSDIAYAAGYGLMENSAEDAKRKQSEAVKRQRVASRDWKRRRRAQEKADEAAAQAEAVARAREAILSARRERNTLAKQADRCKEKLAISTAADAAVVAGNGTLNLSGDYCISCVHPLIVPYGGVASLYVIYLVPRCIFEKCN